MCIRDSSDSSVPSDQQVPAAGEPGYLGAIIRVTGGSLTATGSLRPLTFGLTGSSQYGVYAENGTVTLTNAALTFAEGAGSAASYNTGVYATGAESSVTLTAVSYTHLTEGSTAPCGSRACRTHGVQGTPAQRVVKERRCV